MNDCLPVGNQGSLVGRPFTNVSKAVIASPKTEQANVPKEAIAIHANTIKGLKPFTNNIPLTHITTKLTPDEMANTLIILSCMLFTGHQYQA